MRACPRYPINKQRQRINRCFGRYVYENMKYFLAILILCFSAKFSLADEIIEPTTSFQRVMEEVYRFAKVNPEEVKVVLFKFDYKTGEWQIELMPSKQACLDCYPSYYVKDSNGLVVRAIPHG